MAWTTPRTYVAGEVHTAATLNTDHRDNLLALYAGAASISGQTAFDLIYATSSTQLGRIPLGAGVLYHATGAGSAAAFTMTPTLTALVLTSTLTASGYTHVFGTAGTGTTPAVINVIGHSGAAAGGYAAFFRNLTPVAFVGSRSAIINSGNTDEAALYTGVAAGLDIMAVNAAGDVRITCRNALAATFGASQLLTLTGNLAVAATARVYLDGVGDTYLLENSANSVQVVAGGTAALTVTATNATLAGDLTLAATERVYFDGGSDTYITEVSANVLRLIAGGVAALSATATEVYIPSTNKFFLDGGLDTYLVEVAPNVVRIVAGGSAAFSATASEVYISATNKFFLDGGVDTYLFENAANSIQLVANATAALTVTATTLVIPVASKFYLDGGTNTYIHENSGDSVQVVAGGTAALTVTATTLVIPAASKFYLDGAGNTYIHEDSADSVQVVAGGTAALIVTATISTVADTLLVANGSSSSFGQLQLRSGVGGGGRNATFKQHGTGSSPAEALEIASAGNIFLIPGASYVSITGRFVLGSAAVVGVGWLSSTFDGASDSGLEMNETGGAIAAGYAIFRLSGSIIGSITRNAATSAVLYNTTSDARLKRDLGPALDLSGLRALRVHDFAWRESGVIDRGVFAQEAAAAIGRGVTPGDTGPQIVNPWMVDKSAWIPDLIVGWQQHDDTLQGLAARVTALEAKGVSMTRRSGFDGGQSDGA